MSAADLGRHASRRSMSRLAMAEGFAVDIGLRCAVRRVVKIKTEFVMLTMFTQGTKYVHF